MIFCLAKGHLFIGKRLSFGKQKITFLLYNKKDTSKRHFPLLSKTKCNAFYNFALAG
ncbi:hypothetical protein HMPREF3218_0201688 [Prevotella bivia]|nr:hypothetical protein HMPREF3218_0201688 [Prevotella bivia]